MNPKDFEINDRKDEVIKKCKNIIKRVTNNIRNNDYKKFFGHKRNIKINFLKFIKYNNC